MVTFQCSAGTGAGLMVGYGGETKIQQFLLEPLFENTPKRNTYSMIPMSVMCQNNGGIREAERDGAGHRNYGTATKVLSLLKV